MNQNKERSYLARAGDDIEEAVDRDDDEKGPSTSNARSTTKRCFTRLNDMIGLLLVVLTVIAVLIPTVFLKQDEAGVWKRSFYCIFIRNTTEQTSTILDLLVLGRLSQSQQMVTVSYLEAMRW
jgi:hypothetical protein